MQTAEQSILERIKVSRSTTEPEQSAPTENTEAVNVSEDAPVEEVVEPEAIVNEEVTTETEEPAEEVTAAQANDEETDLFYYDLDGEEVSSDQLKEWKANGLMQADYTRKTQELSNSRKDFDDEVSAFKDKQSKFDSHIATLEAMINEEALNPEALAELREYDPEKYIEYTEKLVKRKQFIDSNKSTKANSIKFDVEAERSKLWDKNPTWLEDGKQTKAFTVDMDLIQTYAKTNGYSNDDFATFKANEWQTILDAAKFNALNNKNVAIEKKVRRAPVITKPRAVAKGSDTAVDKAQKAFNKNPSVQNAAALRTAKRQLNT
jgi:hypothetical protein